MQTTITSRRRITADGGDRNKIVWLVVGIMIATAHVCKYTNGRNKRRYEYRVGQKMAQFMLSPLTLSNINRFSKFFHCQNQEKICNNIITKDPTTPQVCRYTTLWNVNDQWRDQWNAATVCPTQWRSPALAGWLSWIVDVDRPSAEGHPK